MILLCRTSRMSDVRSVGPGKCLSTDSQHLFEVRPHSLEICNENGAAGVPQTFSGRAEPQKQVVVDKEL